MAAAETLVIVAPQYGGDSRAADALTLAASRVAAGVALIGDQADTAIAYLAAHILTLADRGTATGTSGVGLAGPVTSVTTASLSVSAGMSWGGLWWGNAALMSTPYGQEYLALIASTDCGLAFWSV